MEGTTITTLLIEDNPDDAVLIQRLLKSTRNTKYNVIHVEKLADGLACLSRVICDIILLDLALPDGPLGLRTFDLVYAQASHIPIIVLTGQDDDEIAIQAVQKGAQDYLVKGSVSDATLPRAIRYAIERKKLLVELERSMKEIKQLRGFLPICMNCKKIRDDKGYWTQVEVYISQHSDTTFSHGICPECVVKLYPEFANRNKEK
ncbi:MAG TPA: response regulator, partial [Nitrospirota bacterium]|nr:response regulator [Nitrospirota bacterium]